MSLWWVPIIVFSVIFIYSCIKVYIDSRKASNVTFSGELTTKLIKGDKD